MSTILIGRITSITAAANTATSSAMTNIIFGEVGPLLDDVVDIFHPLMLILVFKMVATNKQSQIFS